MSRTTISCSIISRLCLELLAGLPLKYLAIYVNLIDHNQAVLCRQIVLEWFDCMHGLADKQCISFDHSDDKQTTKLYIHSSQHNTLVTLIEHKPQVLKSALNQSSRRTKSPNKEQCSSCLLNTPLVFNTNLCLHRLDSRSTHL